MPEDGKRSCLVCGGHSWPWSHPYGKWQYLRCTSCGHATLDPQPTAIELKRFYDADYSYSDRDYAQATAESYLPLIKRAIASFGKVNSRALDIGANTGTLLLGLRELGWQVAGVELGEAFRSIARDRGVDVYESLQSLPGHQYGLVTAMHVIEHIPDVAREVVAWRRLVTPGGLLIIKTPNAQSWAATAFPDEWQWSTPPAHVHLFSPQSIRRLVTDAGFTVVDVRSSRGNAKPLVFELLRCAVHAARGREGRAEPGRDRPQFRSDRWWYRTSLLPFELGSRLYRRLFGWLPDSLRGAELTMICRAPTALT